MQLGCQSDCTIYSASLINSKSSDCSADCSRIKELTALGCTFFYFPLYIFQQVVSTLSACRLHEPRIGLGDSISRRRREIASSSNGQASEFVTLLNACMCQQQPLSANLCAFSSQGVLICLLPLLLAGTTRLCEPYDIYGRQFDVSCHVHVAPCSFTHW